ncbi:MAG: MBL fold metallo-hydrolase [Lentisphaeria bacterium]
MCIIKFGVGNVNSEVLCVAGLNQTDIMSLRGGFEKGLSAQLKDAVYLNLQMEVEVITTIDSPAVALDCIGGKLIGECLRNMVFCGYWIMTSTVGGSKTMINLETIWRKCICRIGRILNNWTIEGKSVIFEALHQKSWPFFTMRKFITNTHAAFPIRKAEQAHGVQRRFECVDKSGVNIQKMKLYMFQCGTIRTKKHLLVAGPVAKQDFVVPVPFFLIKHPKGTVLFDTGQPMSAVHCAATGNYIPVMTADDYISNQLKKIGLKTTDITHIVLSHLHSDHAGGIEAFSDVVCYIQKAELNKDIINKYPLRWHILTGDYDVFGDGKIQIIFTPGHSLGHQSLLLKLEETGNVLLTADAIYTEEILKHNVMPGVFQNRDASVRTIEKIRQMYRKGVMVISGHDPQAWGKYKLAPAYYK